MPTAKKLLPAFTIIFIALCIYAPALNGQWLWDDNELIVSNARLHTLAGLGKIWFAAPTTDYWPLTFTALWVEWHLFGAAPFGYHLVSLALHLTSAFLIWRILARLGCKCGWLGGILFAVHPLAVESVAWASEIKNTLSLPLFLLAFDAWLDADAGRPRAYPRSIVFYLLAMLAKSSVIMLPFVLALHCWWARGRITRAELLRLAPYFAIALVLGAVTIHFQNGSHDPASVESNGLTARLILAGTSACFYLGKFLLPFLLLAIYPAWSLDTPAQLLALPALVALIALLIISRNTWARHALFGLGFFLLTALPVLGLVTMQWMEVSPVADHLIYLPMVGLTGLFAAAAGALIVRSNDSIRPVVLVAIGLALAALTHVSRTCARRYADPRDYWIYTLQHNPGAWPAWNGLGVALMDNGRFSEASKAIEEALRLKPDYAQAYYDLGNAQLALGNNSNAIADYQYELQLKPNDANALYNLGNADLQAGRITDALAQFEQALALIPDSAEIRGNYGQALARAGRNADALTQFQLAAQLDPASHIAAFNLAVALEQSGQAAAAIAQYQRALQLAPDFTPAQKRLAHLQAKP